MLSTNGSAEHYWPNIKKAILQNPAGQPDDQRMKPQCPVCFERFNITTFSRPSGNSPTCVVLFCGHVMCRGCLGQTERHNSEDAEKKCPCCRTPLACTQCGQASKTFAVPDANTTPDSVFEAPLTKPENPNTNVQPKCHRCAAGGEWLNRIDNGDYPRGAETIEPGAVRFFYGTVDALESEGRPVTPGSVSSAFGSVTNDEYQMLTSHRNDFMSQRRLELETANPWFGSDFGRDRYGSSSHRHEHRHERRRETNIFDYRDPLDSPLDSQAQFRLREYIDYQAPLDPPLDTEARFRRSDFEERRRIHDRLPDERSLRDQLNSLNLGSGQRLDPFGRPQRGDERGHAQHRFDESRFDERPRRDTGRANYDDFGGRRDTGHDAFSDAQYGRDTGNRYSDRHGRDTGNGTPHARNTGNPFGGTQYGEADPFAGMSTREMMQAVSHRQYARFVTQSDELLAEFEINPEAQRIYREEEANRPRERVLGDWTDEDRADPLFIRWRKEDAVRQAQWAAAMRGDGSSHRRRR
ncbi:hypothetical protein CEP54_008232 [Fusarium duplospermum]|uniref:RING-type domain-containing protein n=1 Tax=Fusarium duplospermum TaxID=1325734 RepID=A0A428PWN4_9HYPO|nr:hypothetical protein CEP54_008232 [Fusarium duplospermum]